MDREAMRKDLNVLQVLMQLTSAEYVQNLSHVSENYWVLRVLAEWRGGKRVDEVLRSLDDAQAVKLRQGLNVLFAVVGRALMQLCRWKEEERRLQPDGPETRGSGA